MSNLQKIKKKQLLICSSAEQLAVVASLFPKFECRYVNGDDWTNIGGYRVVCFGLELAQKAFAHALETKFLPAEIPPGLAADEAIQWAKNNAVPLDAVQHDDPPPAVAASSPSEAKAADNEDAGGDDSPAAPPPLAGGPRNDAEPPPHHSSDFPPEASLTKPEQPHTQETDFRPKAITLQRMRYEPPPVAAGAVDWQSILIYSKAGPLNNLDNLVRVIEHDPTIRGRIWYDEFLDAVISDWQSAAPHKWRDSDDVLLQLYVQRHIGLTKISVNTAHDAALVAAFRNVRNECREWLSALVWDGTERLAHVLPDAFGAEKNAYTDAVGKCWFISMVARVMEPGCKVDTVPVLEGPQGVGKSSALKVIGDKWFAECHESVLTKDWYGVLDGHMLVEISEMHSFTRGEVERVKGLISCQVDRYRRAYGRNTEDHPRQSVLVCTTNRDDWQRDETGARRFWPVLCGAIDLAWLVNNREQLFAEAVALYREGVKWWHVPEADQEHEVEKRRDHDSWEPKIQEWLVGRDKATTGEVLELCFDIKPADQDVVYQRRVARVMRALGWRQKVSGRAAMSYRVWVNASLVQD